MTSTQTTLLDGDIASQYRFTLCSLMEDALRVVRTGGIDGEPASEHDIDRALQLVRRISDELRILPGEEPIPF